MKYCRIFSSLKCGGVPPYKMRKQLFAQSWHIFKPFIAERGQFLGRDRPVVQDEPRHGSSTGLCPNGLYL